jgi:hypothetical protein
VRKVDGRKVLNRRVMKNGKMDVFVSLEVSQLNVKRSCFDDERGGSFHIIRVTARQIAGFATEAPRPRTFNVSQHRKLFPTSHIIDFFRNSSHFFPFDTHLFVSQRIVSIFIVYAFQTSLSTTATPHATRSNGSSPLQR